MKTEPGHVTDLLPAHANGTLGIRDERRVRAHLETCAACRADLASWEAVGAAACASSSDAPAPSGHVMEEVWGRIEDERATPARSARSRLSLAWQLLVGQLPLVRREIWAASAVTMAVGCLVAVLTTAGPSLAGSAFAVFAPVVAAVGVAFVYGPENDPSLEIALSTPTSPRLVLLARLTLVYGYDLALALGATAVLAAAKGPLAIWPLVSLWIGPMLFLSALALLISLLSSSTAAFFVALALWGLRLAAGTGAADGARPAWATTVEALWHTDALLLPLAAVLLAAAFLCAPRATEPARGGVAS